MVVGTGEVRARRQRGWPADVDVGERRGKERGERKWGVRRADKWPHCHMGHRICIVLRVGW